MAIEILIIWPQAEEAGRLDDALLRSGLGVHTSLVDFYPDAKRVAEIAAVADSVKAIVVGMSSQERGVQLLQDLRAEAPHILAIAAHSAETADLLRTVMRAGASDLLVPPFSQAEIQRCFQSIAAGSSAGPHGTQVAFTPCQGSDGASTVALHVAQGVSRSLGQAALLVDCDVQCGVAAFRLRQHPKYTLADGLAKAERLEEFLPKIVVRCSDFDLVAAPDSPLGLLADHMERLPIALRAARRCYPFVIADLPPGLFAAGLEVLLDSEQVYLVCTPELTSLHLARRRVSELLDSGLDRERLRVILNRAGSRNAVSPKDIERAIGSPVHHTLANDYDAVTEAALVGGLVDSDSRLGQELESLAGRIAGFGAAPERRQESGWKRILKLG
jgi:pilus assembly protein CpaE